MDGKVGAKAMAAIRGGIAERKNFAALKSPRSG
jgi:hypothetical protein